MENNTTKNARYLKITVLFFFLTWLAVWLFTFNAYAYLAPYPFEYECQALSNTDILEGIYKDKDDNEDDNEDDNDDEDKKIPYTLEDYIRLVKGGRLDYDPNFHSELLYRIIPKAAFINTCEYLHKGKAYTFYIKTIENTKQYPYASEVFIIPHRLNIREGFNFAEPELSIFTNGYYTGVSTTTGQIVTFSNSFVPADYFLRDVQINCGIKNVYEPNEGDADYSKANDTGNVFKEVRLSVSGVKEHKQNGSIGPLSGCFMDALFSTVPKLEDLNILYKGLKTFTSWSKAVQALVPVTEKERIAINPEKYITDLPNRVEQAKSENEFIRHGMVALSDNNILIDDYIKGTFLLYSHKPATRIIFNGYYNIFTHANEGGDYIFLSNGKKQKYTESYSKSAQFTCTRDYIMFPNELIGDLG